MTGSARTNIPVNLKPFLAATQDSTPHPFATAASAAGKRIYTCPMHPEARQEHPWHSPRLREALERMTAKPGTNGGGRTLPILRLAARSNRRWRRDESELRFGDRQRPSPVESGVLILGIANENTI